MSAPSQSNVQVNTGTGPDVATIPVTWNGAASNMQAVAPVDPSTGLNASVTSAGFPGSNALCIQGTGTSGAVPINGNVGISSMPALPTGSNAIGSVSVSNFPATQVISGSVSVGNFPAANGPGYNSTGTGQFIPCADAGAVVNCAAAATQTLVTAVSGKRILVCSVAIISNGTSGTIQFVYGSGNTPLTGQMAFTAETGLSIGTGYGLVLPPVPAGTGNDLKVITTGTSTAQGSITYTQVV